METIVGKLLQTGVTLAGVVVFIGGVLYLWRNAYQRAGYHKFTEQRAGLHDISGVFSGLMHGDGRAIIFIGLLLLIATPVARVAFSVVGFWKERDRLYVAVTLVVLAVLMYSLFALNV
jgi:uncharacterized membrane protein